MGKGSVPYFVVLAAVTALAAAPAAARAASVAIDTSRQTLVYTAGTGETNNVGLSAATAGAGTDYVVSDASTPITAGAGCTPSGAAVHCPSAGLRRLEVALGDGDDTFGVIGTPVAIPGFEESSIEGGDGNDQITSGWWPDTLAGGPGTDSLDADNRDAGAAASGGPDTLDGGPGDDYLIAGDRPFAATGGDGNDTFMVSSDSEAGVSLSLDGVANDGLAAALGGLGPDIEGLNGTKGPDTLVGDGGNNRLYGSDGADTLLGLGGDDDIRGNKGADEMVGGEGSDMMDARETEGLGPPGPDHVSCGAGYEYFTAEAEDTVDADCEQGYDGRQFIFRPPAQGDTFPVWFPVPPGGRQPGDPPAPPTPRPTVSVADGGDLTSNAVRLRIACGGASICKGTVTLESGGRSVGRSRFSLRKGKRVVKVPLTSTARRLARGARLRKAVAVVRLDGSKSVRRKTIKLGARK